MFRRTAAPEEPRFLKDLLEALRESEDELAEAEAAAIELTPPAAPILMAPQDAIVPANAEETDTIRAEIALLLELSAEWKQAVRLDREQSLYLAEFALAA